MINLDQHGLYDDDSNEMAQEVREEILRIIRKAGLTPEQAQKMTPQELADKLDGNEGDAEDAEAEQKYEALKNKEEGEAPYIAQTVPQKMEGWVISFATISSICEETCMRMWAITIYSHPGEFMIGSKFIVGRPTAKDCKLALQVAMAYPLVGKSRRPMTLLLAWRMKDMLDEMDSFCMEYDIMPRHETLDVARIACEEYGTDVHGHNHPIDNLTVKKQELSQVEKLREEGNEFFVCKRYQKALTNNRSICYLRLGHADKAIADADEAIRLNPDWDKPYARKAEALRAQGRLDDVQKLYKDCIKRFEHNAFFKDALLKLHEERASFEQND